MLAAPPTSAVASARSSLGAADTGTATWFASCRHHINFDVKARDISSRQLSVLALAMVRWVVAKVRMHRTVSKHDSAP